MRWLQWRRRQISLPAISGRTALWLVSIWALCLVFVDVGPRVRVVHELPLIEELGACRVDLRPEPGQVAVRLHPPTALRIRNWNHRTLGTCYFVELEDGRRGYVVWDPTRMRSAGIHLGLRSEFRRWLP